jgi:hypothetical protein
MSLRPAYHETGFKEIEDVLMKVKKTLCNEWAAAMKDTSIMSFFGPKSSSSNTQDHQKSNNDVGKPLEISSEGRSDEMGVNSGECWEYGLLVTLFHSLLISLHYKNLIMFFHRLVRPRKPEFCKCIICL